MKELRYCARPPGGRSLSAKAGRCSRTATPTGKSTFGPGYPDADAGLRLRRGEIPGLMIERYFPDEGAFDPDRQGRQGTKSLSSRGSPRVDRRLDPARARGRTGRLFGRILKNGSLNLSRPLDPRSVGMIVQNRLKASQINGKLTAHDLRRTFATRLLDDGIDITTVKNMMGHANITTTARYDRRGEEVQKRAARSVRL